MRMRSVSSRMRRHGLQRDVRRHGFVAGMPWRRDRLVAPDLHIRPHKMPWTLSRREAEEPELVEAFLLAIGKALCLANNFEARCDHYLKVIAFTDSMRDGGKKNEVLKALQKVNALPLAQKVRGIHVSGDIGESDLAILNRARESRNFIAHESACIGELHSARKEFLLKRMADLYPHVVAVARGDNLTSQWEYEVCERESAPSHFTASYVDEVTTWVFGDFLALVRMPTNEAK